MRGRIVKSLSGFYYVVPEESGTTVRHSAAQEWYQCRAKGVFRALKVHPLVGDEVEFDITDPLSDPREGNVTAVLPRRNELVRPTVANVDQALLLFAVTHPAPSYNMLDRFLISMDLCGLPAILCFNKTDLATEEEIKELRSIYEQCGCGVLFCSALESRDGQSEQLSELYSLLRGKTTVITGPSGAGKSTLINSLCPEADMETGTLSEKIGRGKNTTRHVELLEASAIPEKETPDAEGHRRTFVVDTPGFTSLDLLAVRDVKAEDLKLYYPEFETLSSSCRFHGCNHRKEPDCAVRNAAEIGSISRIRYQNYCEIYDDLKMRRPVYR